MLKRIIKIVHISGIIGILCLTASLMLQLYTASNYHDMITENSKAVEDIGRLLAHANRYQLLVYKSFYEADSTEDYEIEMSDTASYMHGIINDMMDNKALAETDPSEDIRKEIDGYVEELILTSDPSLTNRTIKELTSSITTLLTYTNINREEKLKTMRMWSKASYLLNGFILAGIVISTIIASYKAGRYGDQYQKEVDSEIYTDKLTGVYNQRYSVSILPGKVTEGYLYMLDMDNFKKVNDTYGHDAGDRALIGFAEALKSSLRASDIPCRLGGDEFLVYAHELKTDDTAIELAERIQKAVSEAFLGTEMSIVTVSCGISRLKQGQRFSEAQKMADEALYYVKEHEKGKWHLSEDLSTRCQGTCRIG